MLQIKELRQLLGVTQKQLADASNVDIRWIQKLESGEIMIENVTVGKFSKLLIGLDTLSGETKESAELSDVKGASAVVKKLLEEKNEM